MDYINKKKFDPAVGKKKQGQLQVVKNTKNIDKRDNLSKNLINFINSNKGAKGLEMMETLFNQGDITELDFAGILSKEYDLEFIENLTEYQISDEVLGLIPEKICKKNLVLPLVKIDKTLVVVFANPTDINLKDNLSLITGFQIQPVIATSTMIKNAFNKFFKNTESIDNLIYDMSFDLFGFDNELAINLDQEVSSDPEIQLFDL